MHRNLRRAEDALAASAGRLTIEQLAWAPEGRWSSAQIVAHLGLTFSRTVQGLERLLERDAPLAGRATMDERLRAWLVVGLGYFPSGRTSPKEVWPGDVDAAEVLATTLGSLRRMDALLDGAAARFGTRVRVMDHPVLGPLSVAGWRKFHWIHTRHHARQIAARMEQAARAAAL